MNIKAISISDRKGIRKTNIEAGDLLENFGLAGDAHGGIWHRQVSLLAQESIDFMRRKGLDVVAGNFAENITTQGIDLTALRVGDHIRVGNTELIISQLGKVCHNRCAIYHQAGDCVMPREGIFGVVRTGGQIRVGDPIRMLKQRSMSVAVICTAVRERQEGEAIKAAIERLWSPGIIRFDHLNHEESNLPALLQDLTATQAVDRVVILDPAGRHLPGLAGYPVDAIADPQARKPVICHCRSLEEIASTC